MVTRKSVISTVQKILSQNSQYRVLFDPPSEQARTGRYVPLSSLNLHSAVVSGLESVFPKGLYQHQHAAIEQVLNRQNAVVATRTSSGKSLIYSLPIFDQLCRDENSTSLLLFPQKALAGDQKAKMVDMGKGIEPIADLLELNPNLISRYDGSICDLDRPGIRERAQIVLSNPDMLHHGLLQNHKLLWKWFFEHLDLVVVDECHAYRGVFGTHVAFIIRRLKQICQMYGANPRFVATSATVGNPQQHMEALTGEPFVSIDRDQDTSRQGKRKFWIVDSDEQNFKTGQQLAEQFVEAGLTVLAFCPSRMVAEQMLGWKGRLTDNSHMRVYRSGLSAMERQQIEDGLRNREVKLVYSTCALELGIDIGAIDVVMCIGFPDNNMSLWQRVGRAARGGREGAAVLVPGNSPLDAFYVDRPNELFEESLDPLALNLANTQIRRQHIACAIEEVGGCVKELLPNALGPELYEVVHDMENDGPPPYGPRNPFRRVQVRGVNSQPYQLMLGERCIGTINSSHLLRECSPHSIYRHGGRMYSVKEVRQSDRVAKLQAIFTRNQTRTMVDHSIRVKQEHRQHFYSDVRIAQADLIVTEKLVCVTEYDHKHKIKRVWNGSQGMPFARLPTEGTFLAFSNEFWSILQHNLLCSPQSCLEACAALFFSLFPTLSAPCDQQDYASGVDYLITGEQAIFLYDRVEYGAGLTRSVFDYIEPLCERAIERVIQCACHDAQGCVRCIQSALRSRNVSKTAVLIVLESLLRVLKTETPNTSVDEQLSSSAYVDSDWTCNTCNHQATQFTQFCWNCGDPLEVM
ncbi:MAG: DEAD/DEAH box helicase [Planctomycetaceae bacterium]